MLGATTVFCTLLVIDDFPPIKLDLEDGIFFVLGASSCYDATVELLPLIAISFLNCFEDEAPA